MKNPFRYVTILAVLACLSISIAPKLASAQAGSAGGSIGNDDKSVSGSRSAPRSVEEPERPARPSREDTNESLRASRKSGSAGSGGVGSFDGSWAVLLVGGPMCHGTASGSVVISGGTILGEGIATGRVSTSGASYTAGRTREGISYTTSGHLSGRSGSGVFRRSDGCTGRWTASRL